MGAVSRYARHEDEARSFLDTTKSRNKVAPVLLLETSLISGPSLGIKKFNQRENMKLVLVAKVGFVSCYPLLISWLRLETYVGNWRLLLALRVSSMQAQQSQAHPLSYCRLPS